MRWGAARIGLDLRGRRHATHAGGWFLIAKEGGGVGGGSLIIVPHLLTSLPYIFRLS